MIINWKKDDSGGLYDEGFEAGRLYQKSLMTALEIPMEENEYENENGWNKVIVSREREAYKVCTAKFSGSTYFMTNIIANQQTSFEAVIKGESATTTPKFFIAATDGDRYYGGATTNLLRVTGSYYRNINSSSYSVTNWYKVKAEFRSSTTTVWFYNGGDSYNPPEWALMNTSSVDGTNDSTVLYSIGARNYNNIIQYYYTGHIESIKIGIAADDNSPFVTEADFFFAENPSGEVVMIDRNTLDIYFPSGSPLVASSYTGEIINI